MRNAVSLQLGPDTTICELNTIVLKAGSGFKIYLWQDGSTADTLVVNAPGTYHVQVTDSCNNIARDTIIVNLHAPVPLSIGPDRSKCNNDTLQVTATVGFINYYWSPNYNISSLNTQTVIVNPAIDTAYYLRAEKTPGCFAFDTIHITVKHSPVINLGNDTSLCSGQTLLLNAGSGFTDYRWSNGNTSMQITADTVGVYSIVATDLQGCKSYDTLSVLNIFSLPLVQLDDNTELCLGSSRTLDAGNFIRYLWQDGSVNRTFIINTTGIFYVDVTDNHGCKGSDTAKVFTILPVPAKFLPADTAICRNTPLTILPNIPFTSYLWNTNSTAPSIIITAPGTYWLQVNDNKNCTGKDSIVVLPKECLKGFFVPNAFTPNGDSKNDKLKGFLFGNVEQFEFIVYNRYGQVVFRSADPNEGWDGSIRGKQQNPGAYTWACKYRITGGVTEIEQGSALLIR
jgi:gliding motility-associated-like protein